MIAPYTPSLTTLAAFKAYQQVAEQDSTDDALIVALIQRISALAQQMAQTTFVPYDDTRKFVDGSLFDDDTLEMDEDLLAVSSMTDGSGATLASDAYRLIPLNAKPHRYIRLGVNYTWGFTRDIATSTVSVTGAWGMARRYPACFEDVGVTLASPLNAMATSITFASADDAALFSRLTYLRINDETLQVTGQGGDTSTLTVARGAQGTTATAHDAADDVLLFRQMADIEQAAIAWARWVYQLRDTNQERMQLLNGASILLNEAPSYITATFAEYRRRGFAIL